MAGGPPQVEWYIARDGQQHGPLSDLEMRKFVELGHLRPTDLVWRQGFPDWRPAPAVFPAPAPQPRPQPGPARPAAQPARQAAPRAAAARPNFAAAHEPRSAAPEPRPASNPVAVAPPYEHDDEADMEDEDLPSEASGGRVRSIIKMLALVVALGGASWLAVDYIPNPANIVAMLGTSSESSQDAPEGAGSLNEVGGNAEEIDSSLQRVALWHIVKREFPEWYQQRLEEAARLKSGGRDDGFVSRHLAQALVTLRRQHAEQALAASPDALRGIAGSFLDSLKHLAEHSTQACYGFISQGEASPEVLELMNSPEHLAPLQRQAAAMFNAVAEGKRSPQTHLPPRQSDYQALTQELTNRGWTERDIQLFSNPRALAQAPPEEVCRLVQDWFAAQLAIEDQDIQLRLLIESLKPVVAG